MVSGMKKDNFKIVDKRGQEIKRVEKFNYLESMIQKEGGSETAIRWRRQAEWYKSREMAPSCDKGIPILVTSRLKKTVIRPVLT